MSLITSRQNQKIKLARSLRTRKGRDSSGMFLVEGIHLVGAAVEAHQSGINIEGIFYAPDFLHSDFATQLIHSQESKGVPCYATASDIFQTLAAKENPQGIIAVIRKPKISISQLMVSNFPWGVAAVAPQDPGNVGTLLRTIDAVGASGLILLGESTDPFHPSAVRASMGAIFWYPVVKASLAEFTHWVEENGYNVYGSSAHGSTHASQVESYQKPLILLLGSERNGLTPEQTAFCKQVISLPMHGHGSSLNFAVAASVLLYSILEHLTLPKST